MGTSKVEYPARQKKQVAGLASVPREAECTGGGGGGVLGGKELMQGPCKW